MNDLTYILHLWQLTEMEELFGIATLYVILVEAQHIYEMTYILCLLRSTYVHMYAAYSSSNTPRAIFNYSRTDNNLSSN